MKGSIAGGVSAGPAVLDAQPVVHPDEAGTIYRLQKARRILLKRGIVMSLDPAIGDFEKADLLFEGKKISAIAPDLGTAAHGAVTVDATGMIVMPGFVDTHHHQYETLLDLYDDEDVEVWKVAVITTKKSQATITLEWLRTNHRTVIAKVLADGAWGEPNGGPQLQLCDAFLTPSRISRGNLPDQSLQVEACQEVVISVARGDGIPCGANG